MRTHIVSPISTLLFLCLLVHWVFAPPLARAERTSSREALERVEELLRMGFDDGTLTREEWAPGIIVSTQPAFEESKAWFPTAATETLARALGRDSLRVCEACLAPRTFADGKQLQHTTPGGVTLPELAALDDALRGKSAPARAAYWLDETPDGVSLRVLAIPSGKIVYAITVDPELSGQHRTERNFSAARDLLRRQRGESLTHVFFDVGLYPGQHMAFDWLEQWGASNEHLSGVSLSFLEPLLGVGVSYSRVFPEMLRATMGAKVLLSIPTAATVSLTRDSSMKVIDPLLNAVGILRVPAPFLDSNYGLCLFVSSNGKMGIGFSTFNMSLLPVLP